MLRDVTPANQDAVRALVLDCMRERWGDGFDARQNADVDVVQRTYVDGPLAFGSVATVVATSMTP